nr:30 kDa spicule matrix protein alpha-like [Lytechinus pictus]
MTLFWRKRAHFKKMRGFICVFVCLTVFTARSQGQIGQPVPPVGPQAGPAGQTVPPFNPQGGVPGSPGGQPNFPQGGVPGTSGGQPNFPQGGVPGIPGGQPNFPQGGVPGIPGGQPNFPQGGMPGTPGGQPNFPQGGMPGTPGGQPNFPQGGMPGNPGGPPSRPHPPNSNGPGRCNPEWTEWRNNCYLYSSAMVRKHNATGIFHETVNEGLTQDMANAKCAQEHPGACLVTINNQAENDFLFAWAVKMMGQPVPVWIGLHAKQNPSGVSTWEWYDGSVPSYLNWEEVPAPVAAPGMGAMLFDADLIPTGPVPQNPVEITGKWTSEVAHSMAMGEYLGMICKHSLVTTPTEAPTTTAATINEVTTTAPTTTPSTVVPMTTVRPVMLNNNPAHLRDILRGGRYGGSRLFEVQRRPANYRQNPYYAVRP